MKLEDPDLATPYARPIWPPALDPRVLRSTAADDQSASSANLLDIRNVAELVSVAVDENNAEHWLLSDGPWVIRLDPHDHRTSVVQGTRVSVRATLRRRGSNKKKQN